MAEKEKIVCPRCGVEQIKRDTCIVCGYAFDGGASEKQKRKEKILTPPSKPKPKQQTLARKKQPKSDVPVVANVRNLILSPTAKLVLLVVVFVAAIIGLNQYSFRSDMKELTKMLHHVRCNIRADSVAEDELLPAVERCVQQRAYAFLSLRGNRLAMDDIVVNAEPMTSTQFVKLKARGKISDLVAYTVRGQFTFVWLGIGWFKHTFIIDGYTSIAAYKRQLERIKAKQRANRQRLEDQVLNIPNTLTP